MTCAQSRAVMPIQLVPNCRLVLRISESHFLSPNKTATARAMSSPFHRQPSGPGHTPRRSVKHRRAPHLPATVMTVIPPALPDVQRHNAIVKRHSGQQTHTRTNCTAPPPSCSPVFTLPISHLQIFFVCTTVHPLAGACTSDPFQLWIDLPMPCNF
jgi:hypothetical protein